MKIFEVSKKVLRRRPVRFLIAGGTVAVFEYCLFAALIFIGTNPVEGNIISFTLGAIGGFLLQKLWVFKAAGRAKRQLASYMVLASVNLVLGTAMIGVETSVLLIAPLLAKFITMALIAASNYLLFSKLIFRIKSFDDSL